MSPLTWGLVVLPTLWILGALLVPSRLLRRFLSATVCGTTASVALQALLAASALVGWIAWGHATSPTLEGSAVQTPWSWLLYDGAAALMLTLVSFIGWVITRYSHRYLHGEPHQDRYYRWTAFTLGCVSWMVLAGNLIVFWLAWIGTSVGLHQLLRFYGDRPAAQRGAWTKFYVSRLGDVALLLAFGLILSTYGTADFARLATLSAEQVTTAEQSTWIALLLVIGALTKSAQVPFHTWLPQTLDTPTPVSALMHAGIVNAGGYLMIRTSPLISAVPSALAVLVILGTVTACYASLVMMTQTSIKRTLAYSTIAQMGFMLLQCGLGAFSAAMLHIIAHSLYKAHAFLTSGSVVAQSRNLTALPNNAMKTQSLLTIVLASVGLVATLFGATALLGLNLSTKPGGWTLVGLLLAALLVWIVRPAQVGGSTAWRVIVAAPLLLVVYLVSYTCIDRILSGSLIATTVFTHTWTSAVVIDGFATLLLLYSLHQTRRTSRVWQAFYVHTLNGFYIESLGRRLLSTLRLA